MCLIFSGIRYIDLREPEEPYEQMEGEAEGERELVTNEVPPGGAYPDQDQSSDPNRVMTSSLNTVSVIGVNV